MKNFVILVLVLLFESNKTFAQTDPVTGATFPQSPYAPQPILPR